MARMPITNGTFTIRHKATGEHRTIRIKTSRSKRFMEGKRIVSLLTGPSNTNDYTPFAFVNDEGTQIHVWRKYRKDKGQLSKWQRIAAILTACAHGFESAFDKYEFEESRHCIRCNRLLTDPESIRVGIGPICRGDRA